MTERNYGPGCRTDPYFKDDDSMPSKRVPAQQLAEPKCDGGVPYVRLGEQCPKCGATADESCRYTIPKLNAEIAALTEQRDRAMKALLVAKHALVYAIGALEFPDIDRVFIPTVQKGLDAVKAALATEAAAEKGT